MEQDRQIGKQADRSENLADSGEKIDRDQTDGQQSKRQNCERTVGTEYQQTDTLADQSQTVWSASTVVEGSHWQTDRADQDCSTCAEFPQTDWSKGRGAKETIGWLVVKSEPKIYAYNHQPDGLDGDGSSNKNLSLSSASSPWPPLWTSCTQVRVRGPCTVWPFCTHLYLTHVLCDLFAHRYEHTWSMYCLTFRCTSTVYLAQHVLCDTSGQSYTWPKYIISLLYTDPLGPCTVLFDLSV
jgi:hypothetical protein